jgi:signal transduction histidine kinase
VLPRRVAASVTVAAVARAGWAIAAVCLVIALIGIPELFARGGVAGPPVVAVVAILAMLGALAALAIRPSWLTLVLYLVVGTAAVYVFLHGVLDGNTSLLPAALVLINRPETALVLVGTAGQRPLPAILWGIGGFLAGAGVTALVCIQLGIPIQLGNAPALTLANYCAAYLGLSLMQRAQRSRVPDYLQLRDQARQIEVARGIENRSVALLHDTVLNDLALIINGPEVLDSRTTARMLEDVQTMSDSTILAEVPTDEVLDAGDAALRNQVMAIVSDFQWRGLNVEVTGDTGAEFRMAPEVVAAASGALRASLENILAHSGAEAAEIIVSISDNAATWTVNDAGRGFDVASIGADRLGLRSSVFGRVESVGGKVKVWSAPGNGTSVLFSLPITSVAPAGDSPDKKDAGDA